MMSSKAALALALLAFVRFTAPGAAGAQVSVTATDLGTLGGATSSAHDLNDAGLVAGSSGIRVQARHAFLWRSQGEGMIDLGTLGGDSSEAIAINADDFVIGISLTAAGETHAFVWTELGGMIDLGTFGGNASRAIAINAAGQIAGRARTAAGDDHAFLVTPVSVLGATFYFRDLDSDGINDLMTDLGTLGGDFSLSSAIDPDGVVVGDSRTAEGGIHAFVWSLASGMIDLGTLGGLNSRAFDVAGGTIVGNSITASGETHAFRWTAAGGLQDLGVNAALGGSYSLAKHVNASGRIAGEAGPASHTATAFVWLGAADIREVPTLDLNPENISRIHDLSSANVIVGESGAFGAGRTTSHAFRWPIGGAIVDLFPSAGLDDSSALAVNPGGVVVGYFEDSIHDRAFASFPALPDVLELGTLGGDDSRAVDINSSDHIVGWAETAPDEPHAFRGDPLNGLLDLGILPGQPPSAANAISDGAGFLVGESGSAAFLWWPTMNVAGSWTLSPVGGSYLLELQQTGNSVSGVGTSWVGSIEGRSLRLDGQEQSGRNSLRRFDLEVSPDGRQLSGTVDYFPPVGPPGGLTAPATGVRVPPPEGTAGPALTVDAPVPGVMQDLGDLGLGGPTVAQGVDELARVIGVSGSHAFLWSPDSGIQDLGTLTDHVGSAAVDVDSGGAVVGTSYDVEIGGGTIIFCRYEVDQRAFRWTSSGMQDLETLLGDNRSSAAATNSSGVVAGDSYRAFFEPSPICGRYVDARREGFIWTDGAGMSGIGSLRPGAPSSVIDLNDAGDLLGSSAASYFLLVPEDSDLDGTVDRWFRDDNADGINDLMYDLGSLGSSAQISALNDALEIAGHASSSAFGPRLAHVWHVEIQGDPDNDGDGFTVAGGDCDDGRAAVNPDAAEFCDGIDNNCDGRVDEGFDRDGDGVVDCVDGCPDDPLKIEPGLCGCGFGDVDGDHDGRLDCLDNCPTVANAPDFADGDFDGVGDFCDNCLYAFNPDQADSGGVAGAPPDGIGDACQCGDVTDEGITELLDVVFLSRHLVGRPPALSAPRKCAVTPLGNCDATDLAVLRSALAGLPPGVEQVCEAALPL